MIKVWKKYMKHIENILRPRQDEAVPRSSRRENEIESRFRLSVSTGVPYPFSQLILRNVANGHGPSRYKRITIRRSSR